MNKTILPNSQPNFKSLFTIFFWLGGTEGLVAIIALTRLPSESNALFGFSPARLAILTAILLPACACFIAVIFRSGAFLKTTEAFLYNSNSSLFFFVSLAISGICLIAINLLQDIFTSTGIYLYLAYAQRLSPLLVYIAVLSLQTACLIALIHRGHIQKLVNLEKPFLKTWSLVFSGLILLFIAISVTRLGLTPDPVGWGKPTVPLLEWQIWLGILFCLLFRLFGGSTRFKRITDWHSDHPILAGWIISILIWALAFFLWESQPVPPGFFATPPRAPNYEIYPFSDAAFYDFHSQSLLIGLGYRGESIPPRPLYILFLAVAHLIAGQEYSRVILFQTVFLALLPVVIYWIGKKLSNSTVGLVAALFVIFREWTSIISTPFTSDITNSKLLFTDIPAALVISLVLLMTIIWLQKPGKLILSLLSGGILGISLLVRTQIIILLPVILFFYWLVSIRQRFPIRSVIIPTLLFIFGFGLAVSPWLSRSYRITGQLIFDHPESQNRLVALRYNLEIEPEEFDRKPGETTDVYTQRLSAAIRDKVISNPGDFIHFVTTHWLNSEIANLQIFPVRFSTNSFSELIMPQHAFWEDWEGKASPPQTGIMLLNLAIMTAGGVFLCSKNSWAGILPLVFNLAYHFSNAAARNSGWRYLVPVDWVFLVYFVAGIFVLINLGNGSKAAREKKQDAIFASSENFSLAGFATVSACIVCIGLLPLLAETVFPRVYSTATVQNTKQILLDSSSNLSIDNQNGLKRLIDDPSAIILYGRMLYPRFYEEKDGEEKTGKTGYAPLPYARYVFMVAGDPEGTVIFPQIQSDLPLRNAEDILLIGCMDGLAVKARLVVLPTQNFSAYPADPPISWDCSPQP